MGGHAAGSLASELAVGVLTSQLGAGVRTAEAVQHAVRACNDAILAAVEADPSRVGMGTTLVALLLLDADEGLSWLGVNLGDSRLYRLHEGRLELVTHDHSEVQEMVDRGDLHPEDARQHPRRNVITRALGVSPPAVPDLWFGPVVTGERFLLCSDGLTTEVTDEVIADVLGRPWDLGVVAQRLVDLALESGGRDNVSVVVVALSGEPEATGADGDDADVTQPRRLEGAISTDL
jgi:protein phosphatase